MAFLSFSFNPQSWFYLFSYMSVHHSFSAYCLSICPCFLVVCSVVWSVRGGSCPKHFCTGWMWYESKEQRMSFMMSVFVCVLKETFTGFLLVLILYIITMPHSSSVSSTQGRSRLNHSVSVTRGNSDGNRVDMAPKLSLSPGSITY